MVAANLVSKDKPLDDNNVFAVDDNLKLLKSAAIYGANASGKSNLASALRFMQGFMIDSSKETQSTDKIEIDRFKLSIETENQPSFFEIVFLMDGKRYRYGFEATRDSIISEWLFYVPKVRETELFQRTPDRIVCSKSYKADGVEERTRKNALFLSVSAQFNVQIAEEILEYQFDKLKVISSLDDRGYRAYTIKYLIENYNRSEIINLLGKLDLGFNKIRINEDEMEIVGLSPTRTEELKILELRQAEANVASVKTGHRKFDDDGISTTTVFFDLDEHESEGTRKIFALVGPLIDTLKNGRVLLHHIYSFQ